MIPQPFLGKRFSNAGPGPASPIRTLRRSTLMTQTTEQAGMSVINSIRRVLEACALSVVRREASGSSGRTRQDLDWSTRTGSYQPHRPRPADRPSGWSASDPRGRCTGFFATVVRRSRSYTPKRSRKTTVGGEWEDSGIPKKCVACMPHTRIMEPRSRARSGAGSGEGSPENSSPGGRGATATRRSRDPRAPWPP